MQYKSLFTYKNLLISLLLVVAFYLRLRVITYGLPDGSNIYHKVPYFSDEVAIVEDFKKLIVFVHTKDLFYLTGWTYTNLGRFLSFIPYALMVLANRLDPISQDPRIVDVLKITQITLSGRIISFLSSFFSLIILYKLLKLLNAKFIYILLSLFYICFNAVDIRISLGAKSNALMNLFILLTLYFSLLWLEKKGKKFRYIVLSSGFSGLAMAARINGGLSFLITLFSFFFHYDLSLKRVILKGKKLILILISFLFTFLLSCPSVFLESRLVLRIWQHAGSGRLTTKIDWATLLNSLRYLTTGNLGIMVFIFTIFLSLFFFKKMIKKEKIIILWFYLYLLTSISTIVPITRYLYPLLNIYILVFYIVIRKLYSSLKNRLFIFFSFIAILFLILLNNFFLGLSFLDFYSGEDIRVEAARFANHNIPKGSSIGTYLYPYFYAPYVPLDYDKFNLISYRAYKELGREITNRQPDYIVVEERGYTEEFIDYFRIKSNYQLIKLFKKDLKNFGPFIFSNSYKEPQSTTIRIFKKT